jgi:hypothetical protein
MMTLSGIAQINSHRLVAFRAFDTGRSQHANFPIGIEYPHFGHTVGLRDARTFSRSIFRLLTIEYSSVAIA